MGKTLVAIVDPDTGEVTYQRTAFFFLFTWFESIALQSEELALRLFMGICNYAFYDEKVSKEDDPEAYALLTTIYSQLDHAKMNGINGTKGGRPKKREESAEEDTNSNHEGFSAETKSILSKRTKK